MIVLMVAASMFTNLKQKFVKCEVITANVGNQLKLRNTRSCIQFYFTNLGLPGDFDIPSQGVQPTKQQPKYSAS